jgi:hypothetical protein
MIKDGIRLSILEMYNNKLSELKGMKERRPDAIFDISLAD